jgi:hypothetical protein
MNWLLKKLGYRDRKYRAAGFSVTIEPVFREVVSVMHQRSGARIHLDGERLGRKSEGIAVHIPEDVDKARVAQITRDLQIAFQALDYGYVIARLAGIEIVSESDSRPPSPN